MSTCPPPNSKRHFRATPGRRSIALIATLAMVAIVSVLLVSFVTAMRQDRTATYSYSQSQSTDQLAKGGLQLIINELRRELARDYAPDTTYSARPLYTNIIANVSPQANGTNSAMPLLIKISTNNPSFSGTRDKGTLQATTNNSASTSLNSRSIGTNRWSRPYLGTFPSTNNTPYWILVTRNGPTNAAGITTLFSSSTSSSSLNNRAYGNTNYVVGRFAYAIYDQGGLLDITVAGHPTSMTASENGQIKGSLAGADLSVVGITNPTTFVNWRNKTTAATSASYISYITGFASTNGFRRVYSGDTTFLSRQDLIKAAINNQAGLTTSVLTNLTTFTREKNASSWGPSTNFGGTISYTTESLNSGSTNRLTTLARYTSSGSITTYHSDSSSSTYSYSIAAGDSVTSHRFPLNRIQWLTPTGPATGVSDAAIQACFGLKWTTSQDSNLSSAKVWRYVGNTGTTAQSSIKTLDTVAQENREPNFFELLQAGILRGSLGLAGNGNLNNITYPTLYQTVSMQQIMRIGACIIDQYDTDSSPTVIEFTYSGVAYQAVGVESLPYITFFKDFIGISPDNANRIASYCAVGLWNPNQTASTPTSVPRVRIRARGSTATANFFAASTVSGIPSWLGKYGQNLSISGIKAVELSSTGINSFSNPSVLTSSAVASGVVSSDGSTYDWTLTPSVFNNNTTAVTAKTSNTSRPPFVALRLPDLALDMTKTTTAVAAINSGDPATTATRVNIIDNVFGVSTTDRFQLMMEYYQSSTTTWIPYAYLAGNNDMASWMYPATIVHEHPSSIVTITTTSGTVSAVTSNTSSFTFDKNETWGRFASAFEMLVDPRTTRFNFQFYLSSTASAPLATSMGLTPLWAPSMTDSNYQPSGYGGSTHVSPYLANPQMGLIPTLFGSATSPSTYFFPATLSHNTGSSSMISSGASGNSTYNDVDGVQRMGDNGLFTLAPATGNPYYRAADRPVVLNRAFQSVAEMGYAMRDLPWKSLDFFSQNSADAGLLDLFCLTEAPESNNVIAGRINLNTRNKIALQAVLAGILTDTTTTTLVKPDQIAQTLVNFTSPSNTSGGPLLNKSELITRIIGSTSILSTTNFNDNDEAFIKTRREAIARALSDVGQTRTWNLLIDIIAQTGKYPPTATTLDQFMVDGEKRYWLHIAIDRLTGEIVDQQLEPVVE